MRIAVVFDTPYDGWDHPDHERKMAREVAAWRDNEPEMDDVRLASDGEVWFLEANANPFISYGHDMAKAAQKAGLDFYRFIQRLVDVAIERYERA